jgi:hypothetical protein
MWLPRQNDFLHVVPVFLPENVASFLPKPFAARSGKQIHGEQFRAVPKPRRQRLFAPLVEGVLRKRDKCHESLNELRFLYFIQRRVVLQSLERDPIKLGIAHQIHVPIAIVIVNCLRSVAERTALVFLLI